MYRARLRQSTLNQESNAHDNYFDLVFDLVAEPLEPSQQIKTKNHSQAYAYVLRLTVKSIYQMNGHKRPYQTNQAVILFRFSNIRNHTRRFDRA